MYMYVYAKTITDDFGNYVVNVGTTLVSKMPD